MRRSLLAVVALGAAALARLLWQRELPRRASDGEGARQAAARRVDAALGARSAQAPIDAALDLEHVPGSAAGGVGRPRSLRGSRTDGGLLVDANGHFVPTIDARRLFDYFLSASGEASPEALRARVVAEIERLLDGAAASEAIALLDRYLTYRERVRTLAGGDSAGGVVQGDLEARLDELIALRRDVLGDEAADAFFADEEAKAKHVLDARRIAEDPELGAEERMARLQALDADLPPEVREARAAAALAASLQQTEAKLRASGAGAADLQAMRERMVGPEAADRLAALDRTRAQWRARVDTFRAERARLAQNPSLSPAERAAAIEKLGGESFSASEWIRVQALDRIEGVPPSS